MKKVFYGLSTLIVLASCKTVDYAVISGEITNKPEGVLTINARDRSFTDTIQVTVDGNFKDTLRTNFGNVVLYDGKSPTFLYVQPKNDLQVNYDGNDFAKTLTISGTGAETSNYLLNKSVKMKEIEGDSLYVLEEKAYKNKLNEKKSAHLALLNSTKGIPDNFKLKEIRNINYEYLSYLNRYQSAHGYYTKNPNFKISEGFLKELDGLDYNNEEDFKFSNNYSELVSSHYMKKAEKMVELDPTMSRDFAYFKSVSPISVESIKNKLLYRYSKYGITYTDNIELFYEAFMKGSTNEKDKEEITKTYNKLKAVVKGAPSPKFADYENHAGGTTSLDDLKGKYVYIDVWATWCGPCIGEIPSLKKVEKKYHNKNIEFVSISIDKKKDYEKWKTMVTEKELGGIQLYADNAWMSKFVQDYQITGIPRFILIDPQGNIVNSNAPRPSEERLITLFDELKI